MLPDGTKARFAPYAASAAVVATVGVIGYWAKGAPSEVPLKIEPAPIVRNEPKETPSAPQSSLAPRRLLVHVAGEVFRPGVYELGPNDRVADALRMAGGTTQNASADRLNLAATLRDGQKIVVPHRDAPATAIAPIPAPADPPPAQESSAIPVNSEPDNDLTQGEAEEPEPKASPLKPTLAPGSIALNSATVEDLDKLPGVGVATAHKILDERERRGGFRALEDLLDIKGIGPAKFEKMRPYLTL